ncbi:MAG: hypothetical protein VX294_04760 [Candidatus Latescibacterota bacterium]|nr:hypothetical protein [Candidatus Latescibacterota bacterium]
MGRQLLASDWALDQPRVRRIVESWVHADKLPHAILLCGPPGVGKREFAIQLASALMCHHESILPCRACPSCQKVDSLSHPDLKLLLPSLVTSGIRSTDNVSHFDRLQAYMDGQSYDHSVISIKQVRELQNEMVYTPREDGRKVAVLFDSELMHHSASNSLLKILEEPSRDRVFILVTSFPERLLPTVLSRCQRLVLRPLNKVELRDKLQYLDVDGDLLELSIRLGQGSISNAQGILNGELDEVRTEVENFIESGLLHRDEVFWEIVEKIGKKKGRNQQLKFLELCAYYLRDLFLIQHEKTDLIAMIDRRNYLNSLIPYWKEEQVESGIRALDQAIESLQRNVSFELVVVDFWRFLRHLGSAK